MQQRDGWNEGVTESFIERREDKILAAKQAFGTKNVGHRSSSFQSGYEQNFQNQKIERKHQYGLWRFVITVMLFFAFLAGVHFDVSYHGWNRERLEKVLEDDTKWQKIVQEVSNVMESIPKVTGK